jgi:predicted O-linked N-acetylglucosamine transferase (SPINDLY family)
VLDTLPYNAHTTGSDALWAGVPMVSCLGSTFPGRVGASLLCAAGLAGLITHDLQGYAALALRLANDPLELSSWRGRLAQHRLTMPLFDASRYRRHIEAAFAHMVGRARGGLPPESFEVQADTAEISSL